MQKRGFYSRHRLTYKILPTFYIYPGQPCNLNPDDFVLPESHHILEVDRLYSYSCAQDPRYVCILHRARRGSNPQQQSPGS